jgi:hypothetical protein
MNDMEFSTKELRNLQYFENVTIDCMAVGHESTKLTIAQTALMFLHISLGHNPGDPFDSEVMN